MYRQDKKQSILGFEDIKDYYSRQWKGCCVDSWESRLQTVELGCEGKFQGAGIQVCCFWAIAGCCSSRENLRERKAALSKWSLLHFQMYVWEHRPLVDKFLAEFFSVFPVPRKNTALSPSLYNAHTMSHCCKKQWQSLVMRFSSLVLILGAGKLACNSMIISILWTETQGVQIAEVQILCVWLILLYWTILSTCSYSKISLSHLCPFSSVPCYMHFPSTWINM
jgi:hypothetical protein